MRPLVEKVLASKVDAIDFRNVLVRFLLRNFCDALKRLVQSTHARDILDVGCGEAGMSVFLAEEGRRIRAVDCSEKVLESAEQIAKRESLPLTVKKSNLYDLRPEEDSAELVLCCEVLEHLEDPESALKHLFKLANPYLIVSVPREPLWRWMNLIRGKYIRDFGNTPGHIRHWSRSAFLKMVKRHGDIMAVVSPLPWTVVLCRARSIK